MNQSNWRNTDEGRKTEGGYSLNIVDLFIRIHILTGKFPTFTKEEAKELKDLLQKLDESMNDEWIERHWSSNEQYEKNVQL
jgi:hypothetical protein